MDIAVASTSREVPCVSPLNKAAKKRKSIIERELETNMTEKMTSPMVAGDNALTSRFGRARKLKSADDFLPTEKALIPLKRATPKKMSPPLSPVVFKMNASKSPVRIPPLPTAVSPSRSAMNSIDELLNQNQSLSRFSTDLVSPSKVGKVYVRRDLIQNRDEKSNNIVNNAFPPFKSPIKCLNNSSHLNTILQRSPSIDVASKLPSPHRTENKVLSPRSAQEGNKTLSPRQVSLIEHPSVIKTLNFSDVTTPKKNKKLMPSDNEAKTENPVILVDQAYEALEKSCTYQANDLAWARVGTYPFWPCLITRDPFSGHIVKEKVAGGRHVHKVKVMHVTFLADNARRGWVHESMLRPFSGLQEFFACRDAFTSEQKKKDLKLYGAFYISDKRLNVWEKAVEEGEMLLGQPTKTRIDILYEIVYKPNQKVKNMPLPLEEKNKRVSIEKRNVSLSESLFDSLFSEDDSKIVDKKRSKKSLDVSDVVTACLDDMASKTGNIKIQKQSHMDRWLQKAKSKTPEKAVEKATCVPEKIRSRKNKRDIPSDDSDVSRTIQKLKKRTRNSSNYLLRTDSSSGVDSEESKRNSLDERLHVNRVRALQTQLNGNICGHATIAGSSTNRHSMDQTTPIKINATLVMSTPTDSEQPGVEAVEKDISEAKSTSLIENISKHPFAIEMPNKNHSSMLGCTSQDSHHLLSVSRTDSQKGSNLEPNEINASVPDNPMTSCSELDSTSQDTVDLVSSFSTDSQKGSNLEHIETSASVPDNHITSCSELESERVSTDADQSSNLEPIEINESVEKNLMSSCSKLAYTSQATLHLISSTRKDPEKMSKLGHKDSGESVPDSRRNSCLLLDSPEKDSNLQPEDINESFPDKHNSRDDHPPPLESIQSEMDSLSNNEDINITLRIDEYTSEEEVENNTENEIISSKCHENDINDLETTGLTHLENKELGNIPDQIVKSHINIPSLENSTQCSIIKKYTDLNEEVENENGNVRTELHKSVQSSAVKEVLINLTNESDYRKEGNTNKVEKLIPINGESILINSNFEQDTKTSKPEETNTEEKHSNKSDAKNIDFQGSHELVQSSTVKEFPINLDNRAVDIKKGKIAKIEVPIRRNSERKLVNLNLEQETKTSKTDEKNTEKTFSNNSGAKTIDIQGSEIVEGVEWSQKIQKQVFYPCNKVLAENLLKTNENDVNNKNTSVDTNNKTLKSKDNTIVNASQEESLIKVSDSTQNLTSLTASLNMQKCVVFMKRINLKPHLEMLTKLDSNFTEISESVDVKMSKITPSKRPLRKKKTENNLISCWTPKVLLKQIKKTCMTVDSTGNKNVNVITNGDIPQENEKTIQCPVDQNMLLDEIVPIKNIQNIKESNSIQYKTNGNFNITYECDSDGGNKNILVAINKDNDDPDFLKYVESKQDMLMEANPDLTQDEMMSHLHSLWLYEDSRKTKEIKSMIRNFEPDCLVKADDGDATADFNSVGPQDERCVGSEDTTADTLNKEGQQGSTEFFSKTKENCKLYSEAQKPIIDLNTGQGLNENQNVVEERGISKESSDLSSNIECKLFLFDNKVPHQNEGNEKETKNRLPNGFKTEQKQNPLIYGTQEQLFKKKPMEACNELLVSKICNKNERLENCEDNVKSDDTTLAQDLLKSQEIKQLSLDLSIELECSSINSDMDMDDPEDMSTVKRKPHKCDSELEDKTVSLHDFEEVTSSSDSEIDVETIKKENSKKGNKYDDPNFTQYMETKRDALMDEHPHLSEEEVLSYLYDMWSFSDSNQKDENKAEEGSLLKGLGQETVVLHKRNYKKRVRTPNLDHVAEICISKDKPVRRKAVKKYNNHDTDSDSELAEKSEKCVLQVNIDQPQSSCLKLNGEIERKILDNVGIVDLVDSEIKNDQFIAELLKPKPNLFKGLAQERLCEICENATNLIKCRGHCGGMFHVECVLKQANPKPEESFKKKKKQGRPKKMASDSDHSLDSSKMNGLDSDGNSDERYQESAALNEAQESHIIEDAEKFETELEVKMKEILENVPDNDSSLYSSGDELDWDNTVAGRCEIIDVKLRLKSEKKPEDYLITFKCNDCQKYEQPPCFVCKLVISPNQKTETRQKCNIIHCNKVYHLECLSSWPQTQYSSGTISAYSDDETEEITCPRHVCHTCVCDDPRGCKTRFSGDKLARCVRCPAVYHTFTKCLPAGTKILNGSHIICPRHYEQKPGRVPYHVNTSWCFICALGGTLICCEYCPMSFHADCLNIQPPEDGYMCEDCETGRLPLYGELVWAKLGNYRWWPGMVLHPLLVPDNVRLLRHSTGEFAVRFFGGNDYFWLHRGRVFPYQEGDTGKVSTQKSKIDTEFAVAVQQAQRTYKMLKEAKENEEERADIARSLLPPHYVRLKVNRSHGSLSAARRADPDEESAAAPCDCRPGDDEPCGMYTQCLNRVLLTECGPSCRAGDRCHNRCFELRLYPKLAPKRTPQRGWGLHTLEDIKRGQFVIEYVGELIDDHEFRRRMRRMHEMRDENYYFLTLDKERMIDAGPKGNAARFMNHSCEPNCETQKWTVLGDVRVGLFALRDIPAGSEVTFNYNLECAGVDKKPCMCGAARCAGYIGAKPKQEEPKPKQPRRKYKKKPRVESPSTSSHQPPVRKPRCSNTSLNASLKSPDMLAIEQDLLIIRNATRDVPSDTESEGKEAMRVERSKPVEEIKNVSIVDAGVNGDVCANGEAKVDSKVNGEEKANVDAKAKVDSKVNGEENVNVDRKANVDSKVNGEEKVNVDAKDKVDSKVNEEEKVNVNTNSTEDRNLNIETKAKGDSKAGGDVKVNGNSNLDSIVSGLKCEVKMEKCDAKGKSLNPLKRKRVSFSSEEVVICYDSGAPQEKRTRVDAPKGYEAAFYQFLKSDGVICNGASGSNE